MATLSKGYTFGATEAVTNTKLHNLADLGSISGIVNADVAAGAAIDSTKLELASAGYLTSGGNFDVTGKYSFSDLSWFNLSSLASINHGQMETMVLASLASIADMHTLRALIPSLASIGFVEATNARIGTTNQGDILYDNGTQITRLTPGTADQFLQTKGASNNPVWADEDVNLKSTTTSASSTNTGDITIEASKKYLVTLDIENATAAPNSVNLRFNSSSNAAGYAYTTRTVDFATSPTETLAGDNSHSGILLSNMGSSANNGHIKGHFFIDTNKLGTTYSAFVEGSFVGRDNTSGLSHTVFGGVSLQDLTITDFELAFGQNASYTIKVYELA